MCSVFCFLPSTSHSFLSEEDQTQMGSPEMKLQKLEGGQWDSSGEKVQGERCTRRVDERAR